MSLTRSLVSLPLRPAICTLFEKSDVCVDIEVVEKHSAVLEHKVEEQIPVDADHVQMCKFANRDDDTYEKLYKRMARMVRDHTQRQQAQQCM